MPVTSRPTTAAASTPFEAHARSSAFRPGTGDITLFNPPEAGICERSTSPRPSPTSAEAAPMSGNDVVSTATFTVVALRREAGPGAPGRAALLRYRDAGRQPRRRQARRASGAELPRRQPPRLGRSSRQSFGSTAPSRPCRPTSQNILTRPRKAGDADAAVDPLSDPAVRTAVADATFEHLVGFEMSQDQLKYNATR